jgi:hypothetical protein
MEAGSLQRRLAMAPDSDSQHRPRHCYIRKKLGLGPVAIQRARRLEHPEDFVSEIEIASGQGALNGTAVELAKDPFLLRKYDPTLMPEGLDPKLLNVAHVTQMRGRAPFPHFDRGGVRLSTRTQGRCQRMVGRPEE